MRITTSRPHATKKNCGGRDELCAEKNWKWIVVGDDSVTHVW